jgi:hypothetical protein
MESTSRWTIIRTEYIKQRKHYYVQCDCGYEGYRPARYVDSGRSTSCKSCSSRLNKSNIVNLKSGNIKAKEKAYTKGGLTGHRYASIRQGATRRKLTFNVSLEYLWDLYVKQNMKCAISGIELTFKDASLDRINSNIGYENDNVQWVHKRINLMKGNLHHDDLVKWCAIIVANNNIPESFIEENKSCRNKPYNNLK